jgi:hypothetical protein
LKPDEEGELLAKKGVRRFDLTGKPMKGWLLIGYEAAKSKVNWTGGSKKQRNPIRRSPNPSPESRPGYRSIY